MKKVDAEPKEELRPEYDLRALRVRNMGPRRKGFGSFKQRYEIIESLAKQYPEVFSGVTDLEAVWRNTTDPRLMLDMVRESNYGEDYCSEITRFIKSTEDLTGVPYIQSIDALTPSDCKSSWVQLDLLLTRAGIAIDRAMISPRDNDFWNKHIPNMRTGGSDRNEDRIKKALATKLRELILNHFDPAQPPSVPSL